MYIDWSLAPIKTKPPKLKNFLKIELNPNRIYGLDILRAFAILSVVAWHGASLMPKAQYVKLFIFDGVSIFFVLSGFLIGGILIKLLKKKAISSKLILNFWIRRWFRTLPNYLLILIILLLLHAVFKDEFSVFNYERYFVFSQNLFSEHPYFFSEAWSLSIEEWFYLLLPILLLISIKIFKNSSNSSVILVAFGIILSVTIFRYFRYDSLPIDNFSTWDLTFRKQVFTRLDSIMYGVIGSYIYIHFKNQWNKYKVQLLLVGVLIFVGMKFIPFDLEKFGLYHCVFSFSITSLATLFLLPYLSNLNNGNGFIYKLLTYTSLISYSMYLVNLSIVKYWMLGSVDWSNLQNFSQYLFYIIRYSFYWILTVVISIIIYKYYEIPITKLRDRIRVK